MAAPVTEKLPFASLVVLAGGPKMRFWLPKNTVAPASAVAPSWSSTRPVAVIVA